MITPEFPPWVDFPTWGTIAFARKFINLRNLALSIGCTRSYMSHIFKGRKEVPIWWAKKIAWALDCSVQEFMDNLAIHIEANKRLGFAPLVVSKEIRDYVDKQAELEYTSSMGMESVVPKRITKRSIKIAGHYVSPIEIERATGLDNSYLSRIFSGSRTPSIKHAKKIAVCLGMGLEEFLTALEDRVIALKQPKKRKAA